MVLGPAQGLYALSVRGAGSIDVLGDRGRADEGHRLDLGVGQQFVDGGLVALEHIEHPRRQAGLGPQPGQPQRRRGILLRRLQDDGVACSDGDGEEPHRHHGREVERADDTDRSQRLADGVDVDLGRGVLGEPALEQMRDTAGELDDLLAARHLAERVGDDLAVLAGDDLGQLALAGVEQFAEVEQDGGALGQRGIPPGRERRGSRVDHRARILDGGQRHLPGDLTGRRIGYRLRAAAARDGLVVHPMGNGVRHMPQCGVGERH